jgi:ribose transport system substrate-binding protein
MTTPNDYSAVLRRRQAGAMRAAPGAPEPVSGVAPVVSDRLPEPDKRLEPLGRREGYLIKSVLHATEILRAFERRGELLGLHDIVERTGFGKGMCFRLLFTLRHCGFIERVDKRYRLTSEKPRRKRFRIGFATQGQDTSFAGEVHSSVVAAAEAEQLELVVVDNRYDARAAVRGAQELLKEGVDLVIEFQTSESVAAEIAALYRQSDLPVIAIDVPHPGATYFGANNYEAGLVAGRCLGRWARDRWGGQVDEILLIDLGRAGALPAARTKGVLAGIREVTREGAGKIAPISIDGDGQFRTSLEQVRRHLRESKATRVLVGAANDASALGAARAFQEAGRSRGCAVVGQNAEPEARAELRQPQTPLIGSVAYFPERYGEGLVRLALAILSQRAVPPAVFVRHELITPENVDHYYPNDRLLGVSTFARF